MHWCSDNRIRVQPLFTNTGSTSKTGQDTECLVDGQHHRRAEVSLHSMDTTWDNIRYKIMENTWDKIREEKENIKA